MNRNIDIVIPVYNDNTYISNTLKSIKKQILPKNWSCQVYVIDDGSREPVEIDIYSRYKEFVTLIRLENNKGVSVARNTGAKSGKGEAILFLDADCTFGHKYVLAKLIDNYDSGYDLCFGQIQASQNGFWSRYQNDVAAERAKRFQLGEYSAMTSSLFLVTRTTFEAMGGFDENYHFGFEDRDLFITMIKSGAKPVLDEDALVYHNDKISLLSVAHKLYITAGDSAARFFNKHPNEYKSMRYYSSDIRSSKVRLILLIILTKPLLWPMVSILNKVINYNIIPYVIKRNIVKYTCGLVYLHGSYAHVKN